MYDKRTLDSLLTSLETWSRLHSTDLRNSDAEMAEDDKTVISIIRDQIHRFVSINMK